MTLLLSVVIPLGVSGIIVLGMWIYHLGWMAGFKRNEELSTMFRENK